MKLSWNEIAGFAACSFEAENDLPPQLRALHRIVTGKIEDEQPVTASGIPVAAKLMTEDWIEPAGQ
jgi:hypothetical protein